MHGNDETPGGGGRRGGEESGLGPPQTVLFSFVLSFILYLFFLLFFPLFFHLFFHLSFICTFIFLFSFLFLICSLGGLGKEETGEPYYDRLYRSGTGQGYLQNTMPLLPWLFGPHVAG